MINQLVTYQFNVTPTDIPDVYTFTVSTTFTTHVPAPVVTVSPDYIDFNALYREYDRNQLHLHQSRPDRGRQRHSAF